MSEKTGEEKWLSQNGAMIEVYQVGTRKWAYNFVGSQIMKTNFRTKFQALLHASAKLKRSMKSLDWTKQAHEEST